MVASNKPFQKEYFDPKPLMRTAAATPNRPAEATVVRRVRTTSEPPRRVRAVAARRAAGADARIGPLGSGASAQRGRSRSEQPARLCVALRAGRQHRRAGPARRAGFGLCRAGAL